MIDGNGYEWGLAITRKRHGEARIEYHRHYNQESARVALHEEHRRMGRGIVPTTAAALVRRQVGDWEQVVDDDD